ncbi:hypothetical protein AJ78_00751 [Emergomyces pasteurianus Ep9510]|uniref:Uncharacterized protein n=1 Tax=Emergomyces pasteurianus Ep9510 TaxID=1447872 RepID=A0A1J9PSR6_9EURO|nr:hypothetical protein AJ78_00751 [Emergomyces pasteurianus Ep9510]
MDEFAQTRGVDDLFDDEIIPLPSQKVEIEYHPEPELAPQSEPVGHEPTPQQPHSSDSRPHSQPRTSLSPEKQQLQQRGSDNSPAPAERQAQSLGNPQESSTVAPSGRNGSHNRNRANGRGYGGERGRGRGRGGGGSGRGGRKARPLVTEERGDAPTPPSPAGGIRGDEQGKDGKEGESDTQGGGDTGGKAQVMDGEKEDNADKSREQDTTPAPAPSPAPKAFAVKGDRSGTGGVKKPKLTEHELTERIKTAKLRAAERAAAHARAEADEASFLERERVAAEKRREEMQNRRVMNGERERNRQRKLDAQTRREWDVEKSAEEFAASGRGRGGGGSSYRRGAHGAVAYDGTAPAADVLRGHAEELFPESNGGYFRGRGSGRGNPRRGRGGRGRGDYFGKQSYGTPSGPDIGKWVEGVSPSHHPPEAPRVSAEDEFPALPAAPGGNGNANGNGKGINEDVTTPLSPQGTWADQVEMTQSQQPQQEQSLQTALSSMTLKEQEGPGS